MFKFNRKTKKDNKIKITSGVKRTAIREKRIKRPGLDNDAFFKDSASSIDVCI